MRGGGVVIGMYATLVLAAVLGFVLLMLIHTQHQVGQLWGAHRDLEIQLQLRAGSTSHLTMGRKINKFKEERRLVEEAIETSAKGAARGPPVLTRAREQFESKITPEQRAECKKWIEGTLADEPNPSAFKLSYPEYVSQANQDAWLFRNLFKSMFLAKRKGIYIDLAAALPRYISNTYFFDVCLGWTGLCIEAAAERARLLEAERGCGVAQACVTDKKSTIVFELKLGSSRTFQLMSTINKELTEAYNRDPSSVKLTNTSDFHYVLLPCDTWDNILKQWGLYGRHVDLLSLDVEGALAEVVASMDLTSTRIDVLVVENTNVQEATDAFEKAGYELMGATHHRARRSGQWNDEVWVRKDSVWFMHCDWSNFATMASRGYQDMKKGNYTAILKCDFQEDQE